MSNNRLIDTHPVQKALDLCKLYPNEENFESLQESVFQSFLEMESISAIKLNLESTLKTLISENRSVLSAYVYKLNHPEKQIDIAEIVKQTIKPLFSELPKDDLKNYLIEANRIYKKIAEKAEILENNQKKVKRIRLIDTVPSDIRDILIKEISESNKTENLNNKKRGGIKMIEKKKA